MLQRNLKTGSGRTPFQGTAGILPQKNLLELRSKVGIVFQNPDTQLFCASVYQEISFGPLNLGIPEKEAAEAVENIIEALEITDFRHRPAHALSGGQKKQVALADILVMKPEIMILDEPFAALDPVHTRIIRQQIDKMCTSGMTVLLATHNTDYALEWADEVILLKNGRVLSQDRPDKVLTDEKLLKETNLELPSVIRLHKFLCSRGIADPSFPVPRNMEDLEKELLAVRS